jgi:hypothetical protein
MYVVYVTDAPSASSAPPRSKEPRRRDHECRSDPRRRRRATERERGHGHERGIRVEQERDQRHVEALDRGEEQRGLQAVAGDSQAQPDQDHPARQPPEAAGDPQHHEERQRGEPEPHEQCGRDPGAGVRGEPAEHAERAEAGGRQEA